MLPHVQHNAPCGVGLQTGRGRAALAVGSRPGRDSSSPVRRCFRVVGKGGNSGFPTTPGRAAFPNELLRKQGVNYCQAPPAG